MVYGIVYEMCYPEHVNVASMIGLFLGPTSSIRLIPVRPDQQYDYDSIEGQRTNASQPCVMAEGG